MQVYMLESSFWRSLLSNGGTPEMRSSFMQHMNILKDNWYVVAWAGWLHLFVTSMLLWQLRSKFKIADLPEKKEKVRHPQQSSEF